MAEADPVLESIQLSRVVQQADIRRTLVSDVSYVFREGNCYSIIGSSGAGKTSFLRLLNRLDEPTGGVVRLQGREFREYAPCELRRQVGFLFQTPHMFPGTVDENLRYADAELTASEVDDLLEKVALSPSRRDELATRLSLGEQQRVALARLLACGPSVLLLDEPTSSLDPAATKTIEKLISSLVDDDRLTAIFVTHSPEQAVRIGGESLLFAGSRLVEAGPVEQVVCNPGTEAGRRYRDREAG